MELRNIRYYPPRRRARLLVPRPIRRQVKRAQSMLSWPQSAFRALPDFCIIGQMKCGTSSLYHYLTQHPQVLPSPQKEVNFFNFDYDLGSLHYRRFFPYLGELQRESQRQGRRVVTGEATPEYLLHPHAPTRAFELLPALKVIVLVRDPVERAFSHYKHGRRYRWEPCDRFEDAIEEEPERTRGELDRMLRDPGYYSFTHHHFTYLERGRYAEQLERWLAVYPKEQILVIRSEALYERSRETFARVVSFLGLEPHDLEEYPNMFVGNDGELHDATRARLRDAFAPHDARLSELVGERFVW